MTEVQNKFYLLFLLPLVFVFNSYSQATVKFHGKVIDHHKNIGIGGVYIKCYEMSRQNQESFSSENGHFNIDVDLSTTKIEFHFLGYLALVIENIELEEGDVISFDMIPMVEDPFGMINYSSKPSRVERRLIKKKQREVRKGFQFVCPNNKIMDIRFSTNDNQFANYIDYLELKDCDIIRNAVTN